MSKNKIFAVVYGIIGMLVIIMPLYVVPVCGNPLMGCRARTLPVMVLLGAVTVVISIVDFIWG